MEGVLRDFCSISGQKVNIGKSKLILSKKTSSSLARCGYTKSETHSTFSFNRDSLPFYKDPNLKIESRKIALVHPFVFHKEDL